MVDWKRGLIRLVAVAGVVLLALAAAIAVIRWLSTISLFVTGYLLLIGGFIALGMLFVALDWILRGFHRNDHRPARG